MPGGDVESFVEVIDGEGDSMHADLVGLGRFRLDGLGVDVFKEFEEAAAIGRLEHGDLGVVPVEAHRGVSPLSIDYLAADDGEAEIGEERDRFLKVADRNANVLEPDGHASTLSRLYRAELVAIVSSPANRTGADAPPLGHTCALPWDWIASIEHLCWPTSRNATMFAMKAAVLAIAALTLTACGGSPAKSAGTSGVTPAPTSPRTSSSITSAGQSNTPQGVAQRFSNALASKAMAQACALVVPAERSLCSGQYATDVQQLTISDMTVHQAVTDGDRALVSVTGRVCAGSQCQGATDPTSGMPSSTLSFDQAWAAAAKSPTSAASPCRRINGIWYVVLE